MLKFMKKFSRFVMKYSESNMYMIIENNQALIIDPNQSETAMSFLIENNVNKIFILLTHEHFDHISGVNWLRRMFDVMVICQERCAESIKIAKNNRPFVFMTMVEDKCEKEKQEIISFFDNLPRDAIEADVIFDSEYQFVWQGHRIKINSSPGHSQGSVLINFDNAYIFTGDYMIPNAPVILRFAGGSKEAYKKKTLPLLLNLSTDIMIMPGHGEPCLRGDLTYENSSLKWQLLRN